MKRSLYPMLMAVSIAMSTGCSTVRSITSPDDKNLLSGAGSIMKAKRTGESNLSTNNFEELDVDVLLKLYGLDNPTEVADKHAGKAEEYRYRRNDLQERLIAASNQRCGAYVRQIVSSKSQTQLAWTGLSTLLSGAAAVVPHVQTAKALAAGSTISTGVLSTYNEAYFNNLAMTVVAAGISKQRDSMLSSISNLRSKTLADYPVNAAIADAVAYHSACNIVVGMEAASKATSAADTATFAPLAR